MNAEFTEAIWLDERQVFSLAELAELSGFSCAEVEQLVAYEALVPADPAAARPTFTAECLVAARAACRLRDDFELGAGGLALALTLLERIRDLEAELRRLQCQSPRHR